MISKYSNFILESKIYHLILEKNLNCSSDFLKKLNSISDKSPVAKTLYDAFSKQTLIDRNLNQNYIEVTDTDNMISFVSDAKMDAGQANSRSQIAVGRFARYIIPFITDTKFTDRDFEIFVNLYRSTFVSKTERFELISGKKIEHYYLEDNYALEGRGQLGASCMRHDYCESYFGVYEKNDNCQLLVYLDSNDKVLGRALVWKMSKSPCEAQYFMDRIYTGRDSDIDRFIAYANEKGWMMKWRNDCDSENSIIFKYKGEIVVGLVEVELQKANFDEYPFMDTMTYIHVKKKIVHNVNGKNMIECSDTTGGYDDECYECGGDGKVEGDCSNCDGDGMIDCPDCSGTGEVKCQKCNGTGEWGDQSDCPECKGTGRVKKLIRMGKCLNCNGTGKVPTVCPECDGSGEIECKTCDGDGQVECKVCDGRGRLEDQDCPNCVGQYEATLKDWLHKTSHSSSGDYDKIRQGAQKALEKLKQEKPEKKEKKEKKKN